MVGANKLGFYIFLILFLGHPIGLQAEEDYIKSFNEFLASNPVLEVIFTKNPENLAAERVELEKSFKTDPRKFFLEKAHRKEKELAAKYFKNFIRFASDDLVNSFIAEKSNMLEVLGKNYLDLCLPWMTQNLEEKDLPEPLKPFDEKYQNAFRNIFISSDLSGLTELEIIPETQVLSQAVDIMQIIYKEFGETRFNIQITSSPLAEPVKPYDEVKICFDTGKFFWVLKNKLKTEGAVFLRSYLSRGLVKAEAQEN